MDCPSPHPFQGLSNRDLAASITELMGHLNAANRRWLAMIAEFDRRKGWSDSMTRSCAHWLNWQCGVDLGAAREKLRVAHALEDLPLISAAMGRGELSYAKVRALTRVANVTNEAFLLMIGLHGTASHVEKLVRQYRSVQEVEALSREERQQTRRSVSYYFDDEDGSLVLKARLPAEWGMQLLKALELAMADLPLPPAQDPCIARSGNEDVCRARDTDVGRRHGTDVGRRHGTDVGRRHGTDVSAETSAPQLRSTPDRKLEPGIPTTARRADALALVAESFLAHGAEAMNGGDRFQIVVHVDHDTLQERTAGRSEFDDGPHVSAETSRRLSCDCSHVTITEDASGEPLNVGRKTRSIPPALRRALNSRDKGCVFPGCTHRKYVDGHHVHHWANGGETRLGNLVSLCRFHHRLVHEGGVRIERLDDGAWRFVRTNGDAFVSIARGHTKPMQGDWEAVVNEHAERDIHIDAHTARTHWRGESLDCGLAIDVLRSKERKAAYSQSTVAQGRYSNR